MGNDTATQTNEPWGPQGSHLQDIFRFAQQAYGQPLEFYPGSTVAPRSAQSQAAEQGALGLARGGGVTAPAERYLTSALGGAYLNLDSNPFLRGVGDAGASDITRHYMSAVSPGLSLQGLGRAGSGAEANLQSQGRRDLAQELSQFYSNLYGGHYAQERGLQSQAAALAPQVAGSRRSDLALAAGIGQGAEQYAQRGINELMSRFDFAQMEPWQRLGLYRGNVVDGLSTIPGTSQSTQSQGFGAAEGLGLASSLTGAALLAVSSAALKERIDAVDYDAMLEAVEQLPVEIWRYKPGVVGRPDGSSDTDPHVGPYAEDFRALFGVGNGEVINLVDGLGIALAAVKALAARVRELERRAAPLEAVSAAEMAPVPVENA